MKTVNSTSDVSLRSIQDYIQDPDSSLEDQYTILKHCRRSTSEIAEIASALGSKHIADIVTLEPRRLALYETIVTIQTEIQLENQEELEHVFREAYKNYLVPLFKKRDSQSGKKLETKLVEDVENEINPLIDKCINYLKRERLGTVSNSETLLTPEELKIIDKIKDIDNQISRRIHEGLYIPGRLNADDNEENVTKKIIFDILYNQKIQERVQNIVYPLIDQQIDNQTVYYPTRRFNDKKPLKRLKFLKENQRHTFMMVGAPASGKSTSYALVIVDAMALGIQARDMVKCNTDSYRPLVSNSKELGDNPVQHASFNYDESYLITKKIYQRIQNKIKQGEGAPHLLIDSVYPTQEKIKLGLLRQGNLNLYCITVPAEVGLKRAHQRGKESGRYIDTASLLQSHRDISANFHTIINDYKDCNLSYIILDNNVSGHELPILVEEGNLKDRLIKVHSLAKLKEFIEKSNINTGISANEVTVSKDTMRDTILLLRRLERDGFKIELSNTSERILIGKIHLQKNKALSIRNSLQSSSGLYSPTSVVISHSPRDNKTKIYKQSDREATV